jgi:hypothetical protein
MARKRKPSDTVQLNLRFSERLRARLERDAAHERRSMNAEIVERLERSYRKEEDADLTADTFRAALGGPTGDLFRAIATAIWLIEKRTGKKWNEDHYAALQVETAIEPILRAFVAPFNAERAFQQFRDLRESDDPHHQAMMQVPELREFFGRRHLGTAAALEALQKMGMAPSDAEIAEAAKRHDAKPKAQDEGDKQ